MNMSKSQRPFSTMSREELAEVSRKGGVASGEARRAKRAEIEADQIMLAAKVEQANDPGVPLMPLAAPPRARRAEIEADQITLAAKVEQANGPGVPLMPLAAPQTAARNGTVKQVPLAVLPHLAVPARARAK
jgi:hypothetical protein